MSEQKSFTPELKEYLDKMMNSDEKIRDIFREIHAGVGGHGDFLRAFAKAVIYADPENFELLKPSCICLILKYDLDKEGTAQASPEDSSFSA